MNLTFSVTLTNGVYKLYLQNNEFSQWFFNWYKDSKGNAITPEMILGENYLDIDDNVVGIYMRRNSF